MKITFRKSTIARVMLALVSTMLCTVVAAQSTSTKHALSTTYNGYLEYLKVIHEEAPSNDLTTIALLVQQFGVLNRHEQGIAYLENLIERHRSVLTDIQRARYIAALAQLRALSTQSVPAADRVAWVRETIDLLETARALSGNQDFLVRWIAGVVYARLPDVFGRQEAALADINWCLEMQQRTSLAGWERELYFHKALVLHNAGNDEAAHWLAASGYASYDKEIVFTTPYTVSAEFGGTMAPEGIQEIVPERVFLLSGFGFSDYYFIISRDGSSLISIDAGTTPRATRRAYAALEDYVGELPPLTDVIFTHAHWDHIGGRATFREINPEVQFHARANFEDELANALQAPRRFTYFFGSEFNRDLMRNYSPDVLLEERSMLEVGGTKLNLIPISGGETEDALLIYLPDESILFTGDFIMPYFGSPFAEEGSAEGFYDAVEIIEQLNPEVLLHGHPPLTHIYNSTKLLSGMSEGLQWLEAQVRQRASDQASRPEIQHANLIPPVVLERPDLHLPYLVARENFINRIYDNASGYWHPDLSGMDYLNDSELGTVFGLYLELEADELAEALRRMVDNGDHELAAKVSEWAVAHYGKVAVLEEQRERAYTKLREKHQNLNPFKFIAYSQMIEAELRPIEGPVVVD